MWRIALVSMGLLSLVLTACEQHELLAGSDRAGNGDYEVVALVAE